MSEKGFRLVVILAMAAAIVLSQVQVVMWKKGAMEWRELAESCMEAADRVERGLR